VWLFWYVYGGENECRRGNIVGGGEYTASCG
jgi:hypothetical protein